MAISHAREASHAMRDCREVYRDMDIALDRSGDMYVSPKGDIVLNDSVSQKIRIRLLWFLGEWRWDPEEGIPYFDDVFIKNPDTDRIETIIREKIFEVTEVTEVNDVTVELDSKARRVKVKFEAKTDEETLREEVVFDG